MSYFGKVNGNNEGSKIFNSYVSAINAINNSNSKRNAIENISKINIGSSGVNIGDEHAHKIYNKYTNYTGYKGSRWK